MAILAKGETPLEIRRGLPGYPSDDSQTRYLEAQTKGLDIASVYLPNGNPVPSANFDYKLRWFARFVRHAKTLIESRRPVLLAGDLIVIPTDFDIYNPSWWRFDAVMQPEARDAFQQPLAQGWMDAVRRLHPTERMYSFWVNERAFRQNRGMRLDFLLVSPALQPLVATAGVDVEYRGREKPSDHTPTRVGLHRSMLGGASRAG